MTLEEFWNAATLIMMVTGFVLMATALVMSVLGSPIVKP